MQQDLGEIVREIGLKRGNAVKLISGGRGLRGGLGVTPSEFLQQAEDDLEAGGTSARLNSITNAKRAIFSQVDQILLSFGFQPGGLGTREKLRLFLDLGFVAPRLLRRVSDARNLLEHEYRLPTQEEVEDAFDLASLFVEASQRYLLIFEGDFCVGNKEDQMDPYGFEKQLDVSYDEHQRDFGVWGTINVSKFERRTIGEAMIIKAGDPFFNDLVRLGVAGERAGRVKRALDRFLSRVGDR